MPPLPMVSKIGKEKITVFAHIPYQSSRYGNNTQRVPHIFLFQPGKRYLTPIARGHGIYIIWGYCYITVTGQILHEVCRIVSRPISTTGKKDYWIRAISDSYRRIQGYSSFEALRCMIGKGLRLFFSRISYSSSYYFFPTTRMYIFKINCS